VAVEERHLLRAVRKCARARRRSFMVLDTSEEKRINRANRK
jgi:hypothetical protein